LVLLWKRIAPDQGRVAFRVWLLAACTLALVIILPNPVTAQTTDASSTDDAASGFDFKLIEGTPVPVDANGDPRFDQMPPLPFNAPDVTPAVPVAGDIDDVDRRTTAFQPTNLEMLTAIEMPQTSGRWIRVDLSEQMVIAYEGEEPVRGFMVSTGMDGTPTVTGTFHIRMKVRSQTMTGGSPALGTYYSLDNVEWVQYFYADYGFHGTYWHNNFGEQMSHGCINMTNADAKWLWDWAGPEWDGETVWFAASGKNPGTLVIVHD
jgi:lipoprotein-anchoring transpeptidase ErfK/SrfK